MIIITNPLNLTIGGMIVTERVFTVTRVCRMSDCEIYIDSDELNGLTTGEIQKIVSGYAMENGNWNMIESEEFDEYEVVEE